VAIVAVYEVYRSVRARIRGSGPLALRHAGQVVHAEGRLGLFREGWIQRHFLGHDAFVRFWNVYYGLAHFVVPAAVLVALYVAWPGRYRQWRNVLGWVLGFGLVGFAVYPLAPPRLLPARYGIVDTVATVGGIGPVGSKTETPKSGNPYAAMPSLHLAWSTWAACALFPVAGPPSVAWLVFAYPAATLFAVVVTGNHYFVDAIGGWAALALAYGVERIRPPWPRPR
jgi:membrane-associated phospholipid phosphatase